MRTLVVQGRTGSIAGRIEVPGDKSISHRALMVAAAASGSSRLRGLGPGEDVGSTIACLGGYGVSIDRAGTEATVSSPGVEAWQEPDNTLDCGNSGTTLRIMAGLAARLPFASTFDGDGSLRRRPMGRVARPLRALGAQVEMEGDEFPPLVVRGGDLKGTEVDIGVASAQVKSCVLLAGLGADGRTTVVEPLHTRDHTERMLEALGIEIEEGTAPDGSHHVSVGRSTLPSFELDVAGDVSSAAFVVAAAVLAGSVSIDAVGLNPTRIGFLETLRSMGASVEWEVSEIRLGEPVGRVSVSSSSLRAFALEDRAVPTVHDEIPLLGVLATQAEGETLITGASELRVKESDRISSLLAGLVRMGADVQELHDGFRVRGPVDLKGARVDAAGDHRIAMAFAVAGLVAKGETLVEGFESASVSWPGFDEVLAGLGADVELR